MQTVISGKESERVATSADAGGKSESAAFTGAAIFVQQLAAQGDDFAGLSLEQQEWAAFACPPVNEAMAQ